MQIRKATSADAEAITQVFMDSAEHHATLNPQRCYVPASESIIDRYRNGHQHPVPGPDSITFVAEENGSILGFLDARIEEPYDPMIRPIKYCFVSDIAVSAAHRSRGIGEKLMHAAERWARERGAGYVLLEYGQNNSRAAALYERLGYSPTSITMLKWLSESQ